MIVNAMQDSCIHLFQISHLVNLAKNFTFLRNLNSGFSYIEVWVSDQNSKALELEDKINVTLGIN